MLPNKVTAVKKSHNSKHKSKKSSKSGGSPVMEKEKNYKSYAGFTTKSVRCMWEQHERSNETEVASEALEKVAEDVTYKVWELVNTIKTYANKSGGRVTTDLVNEVLKDSNVDPIFGSSRNFWDRVESDGTVFFHFDEEIDLQEEYTKDVVVEEMGPLNITSGWYGEPNRQQELIEFYGNVVDGIYFGEEDLVDTILEIVATSPHVALICKLLLNKCVEMLAFEYTDEILEQTLKLLRAIVQNPFTQNGSFLSELSFLSQIFEGLLLGSQKVFNYLEDGNHFPVKMELQQLDEDVSEVFPAIQQGQEELIGNLKSEAEYPHLNEIKKECEDLFIMMNSSELPNVKKEEQMNHNQNVLNGLDDFYGHQQPEDQTDNVSIKISEVSSEPEAPPREPKSRLVTLGCSVRLIEDLCHTIGLCTAHWGHVEQELTFYLVKRLEEAFKAQPEVDLEFVLRVSQGLWAIGEFAFRELTPYLEKIDPQVAPENFVNVFNKGAIYIRGRNDIFLYEWLADLCGSSLTPFLIFYANSVQKYNLKRHRRLEVIKKSEQSFKVPAKLVLAKIPKHIKQYHNNDCRSAFESYCPIQRTDKKKFNFRFAGCRPVSLRGRKNKVVPTVIEHVVIQQPLESFNSKVVIGKRRLMKPITNVPKVSYCANYHFLEI